MVKVNHHFKAISRSPLLLALIHQVRAKVKGLCCTQHPDTESTITYRLLNGRPSRTISACCQLFEQTLAYEISAQASFDKQKLSANDGDIRDE